MRQSSWFACSQNTTQRGANIMRSQLLRSRADPPPPPIKGSRDILPRSNTASTNKPIQRIGAIILVCLEVGQLCVKYHNLSGKLTVTDPPNIISVRLSHPFIHIRTRRRRYSLLNLGLTGGQPCPGQMSSRVTSSGHEGFLVIRQASHSLIHRTRIGRRWAFLVISHAPNHFPLAVRSIFSLDPIFSSRR